MFDHRLTDFFLFLSLVANRGLSLSVSFHRRLRMTMIEPTVPGGQLCPVRDRRDERPGCGLREGGSRRCAAARGLDFHGGDVGSVSDYFRRVEGLSHHNRRAWARSVCVSVVLLFSGSVFFLVNSLVSLALLDGFAMVVCIVFSP